MTTNQIFLELAQRLGAGGDVRDDFPFTLGDMMPQLDYAYSKAVKMSTQDTQARKGSMKVDPSLVKEYELTITRDGQHENPYSTLPVSVVRLPRNMGVHGIFYKANNFDRTTPDYVTRFAGLNSPIVSKQTKFFVVDDVVSYINLASSTDCVKAYLVPLPSSLEEDEEILFPSGYEDMILDTVLQRMGFTLNIPEDNSNNGKR